jgi:Phosducin
MRAAAARPRFGSYDEIGGGAEFVQRVTEASAQSWVACVLHQPGHAGCGLLHPALEELARRYPGTRFVRVLSTSAIPRYPDANLPTLLLYRRRKLVANLVGLQSLGGRRVTPESVALALNTHGRVCVELGDEGSEDEGEGGGSGGGSSTVAQVRGLLERLVAARDERGRASGDESSDFGDD